MATEVITCRGSIEQGTGCGRCKKCQEDIKRKMNGKKKMEPYCESDAFFDLGEYEDKN